MSNKAVKEPKAQPKAAAKAEPTGITPSELAETLSVSPKSYSMMVPTISLFFEVGPW